jgi:hypothetical protein
VCREWRWQEGERNEHTPYTLLSGVRAGDSFLSVCVSGVLHNRHHTQGTVSFQGMRRVKKGSDCVTATQTVDQRRPKLGH